MTNTWVERWFVPKSKGDGHWTVARHRDGQFGCSCPVWKFSKEKDYAGNKIRKECHHIRQIKGRTDLVDAAEVMARMTNATNEQAFHLLRDAYIKSGYLIAGYISNPPDDWQKLKLEQFKHDPSISLVCIKISDRDSELMIKKLL